MPHIHELIDFTVAVFIVHNQRVLLVDHTKLKTWLPIGGHIELDEDPEQALYREVKEECGLDIELVGERPPIVDPGTKGLIPPRFLDIHNITATHRHIGLVYIARSSSAAVVLAPAEHRTIRWFSRDDLVDPQFGIKPSVQWYAQRALIEVGSYTKNTPL